MRMTGKHAVIFGGGSGMGRAIATGFIADGGRVTVVGRSAETLDATASELGDAADFEVADFSDAAQLAELTNKTGAIDHLVLCASSSVAFGALTDVTEDQLRAAFDNKFFGYWLATQALLQNMAPDGSILMVTGAAHRAAIPGMSAVAAVNGAIASFAQVLAIELAPLRVNILSPGIVHTHVYDGMPQETRDAMFAGAAAGLPVGRIGAPDDIAVIALATLQSPFTTGALIDVDGGAHLAHGG